MKSFTLNSAKRFLRQINPFSRHGFHVSKIRHGRFDYLSYFVLHRNSGKLTAGILSFGTIALLFTSFSFANAAPSGNPPSSNVAPNFNGVNINSQTNSNDTNYVKGELKDVSNQPSMNLRTQKDSTHFSFLQMDAPTNLISIGQQLGTLFNSFMLDTTGIRLSTTGPLTITGNPLTLNGLSINSAGGFTGPATFNGETIHNGTARFNSTIYVDDIYRNSSSSADAIELHNKTYFHDNLLIDNSAIGFTGNNGYIRPETYTSPAHDRTVARSGRLTDTCSYYKAGGNLNAKVYGYPLACAYQVEGNTSGSISVVTSTSPSGNACYYDWSTSSLSSSTTTYFLTTTLCYRGEFVGL
ncbi:hypothetical protein COV81_01810 [Candidatus Peregrinibacteria bacterium CG11_big_fil_rev_8_21_14_0_20_41_10]|nr:MAG: hypothetical protein COV81_01810 [Candidatus Peregrinibacteria bacterium CG11_big_fil_rev_8_21_14_0_20_41_10]PIZ77256.1 MAG: hypothetical protein COY06_00750 [Candidatus Peregrinibacteria bacterium CG_4_10_14_0_2_um_filter_41_8]PJC37724.1 MAG: hypothetical protein CO045_03895 [Candidatus Peregrinibacteria bacterium CG_4_9_14_0_2_um_filter_41_14]